MNNQDQER